MGLLEIAVLLAWLAIVLCLWAVYQLVAQNGRLLLRMEALERHLGDMVGLSPAVYAGQLASADETADESHSDESGGPPGIPPGTVLHEFELPDLDPGATRAGSTWTTFGTRAIWLSSTRLAARSCWCGQTSTATA